MDIKSDNTTSHIIYIKGLLSQRAIFLYFMCIISMLCYNNIEVDINSLDRFLKAQERMYPVALKEIQNGKKESHWMWYIFPQLRGLGKSQMAYTYGINGIEEAKAYLAHPVLSARLFEICEALLKHKDKPAYKILGDVDSMKLLSSMTLFSYISEKGSIFQNVLDIFYKNKKDKITLELIQK